MSCAQCKGVEATFNERTARRELKSFRKKGPRKATRLLIAAIQSRLEGKPFSFIDIGGGVGALQHEFLSNPDVTGVSVDASASYLNVAKAESKARGTDSRIAFHFGDFVNLAQSIDQTDIVTMDRVLCCYDEVDELLGSAAKKSSQLVGLVYPKDVWYNRIGSRIVNQFMRLRRSTFRTFIHPTTTVINLLAEAGFNQCHIEYAGTWQVALFEKPGRST